MMVIQQHQKCWEMNHIVGILCQVAKSLQATISSFIFNLIGLTLKLVSNWNIMQQVRIHTKQIFVHFVAREMSTKLYKYLLNLFRPWLSFLLMKLTALDTITLSQG